MQGAHESILDRHARRRVRRWVRRARVFAPLLAVPGTLGVLLLSVNLIERRPDPSRRGMPQDRSANSPARAERESAGGYRLEREPIEAASVLPAGEASAQFHESVIADALAADMPVATSDAASVLPAAPIDAPTPAATDRLGAP